MEHEGRDAAPGRPGADRVELECFRSGMQMARNLAWSSPISAMIMVIISRPGWPAALAYVLVVSGAGIAAAVGTPRRPAALDDAGVRRWYGWFRWYSVLSGLAWVAALALFQPAAERPEVQTLQVLTLVAIAYAYVLNGAYLPWVFRWGVALMAASMTVALAVWGVGVNRLLVPIVPVFGLTLVWIWRGLRETTVQAVELNLQNAALIAELEVDRSRLAHEATHDHLTGLANRAAFLEGASGRLAAPATGARPALAYLDLDGFKGWNDRCGHALGDAVLCEVARRIRAVVPAAAIVARMGGDEFTVLLVERVDLDDVAVRLLESIAAPFEVDGVALQLRCSIGVAVARPVAGADAAGAEVERLLAAADAAMYRAKSGGGHRYVVVGERSSAGPAPAPQAGSR